MSGWKGPLDDHHLDCQIFQFDEGSDELSAGTIAVCLKAFSRQQVRDGADRPTG